MANKKTKGQRKFETQVYIRKIERNKIKKYFKTNKIKEIWKRLHPKKKKVNE